jgi:hypothetical protein
VTQHVLHVTCSTSPRAPARLEPFEPQTPSTPFLLLQCVRSAASACRCLAYVSTPARRFNHSINGHVGEHALLRNTCSHHDVDPGVHQCRAGCGREFERPHTYNQGTERRLPRSNAVRLRTQAPGAVTGQPTPLLTAANPQHAITSLCEAAAGGWLREKIIWPRWRWCS